MKVLIIEDEQIAAERLKDMICAIEPTFEIVEIIDSVAFAIKWFSKNETPDLIFLDIQLADGVSFSIFEKIDTDAPIIFTTAYDQYAVKAFKLNSVDYLLKPIVKQDLIDAINKFNKRQVTLSSRSIGTKELLNFLSEKSSRSYKERFVIKVGEHIRTIQVADIKLLYSQDKATYALTVDGKRHIIDYTLDESDSLIDKNTFFRINRKYIISIHQIEDILTFSNSRLKLILKDANDFDDLIVARDKVQDFKSWLDR